MQCAHCQSRLPAKAKFCPHCGIAISARIHVETNQDIGTVEGKVVGNILGDKEKPASLHSTSTQKVNRVQPGGTVIGTTVGEHAQIGGERHYGNIIQGDNIEIGNVTKSTGVGIGKNAQGRVNQGVLPEEIVDAFANLLELARDMPEGTERKTAQSTLENLESEAAKGEQADESKVDGWFSSLAQLAPDIWEVAIDTFINPLKGLSTVFKKVAERGRLNKKGG